MPVIKKRTTEDILSDIKIKGIIHVGANTGQEVPFYASLHVPVLYFEPLREPFFELKKKIEPYYPLMSAAMIALGPEEGSIDIFESSKEGVSSSILMPDEHLKIYPNRTFRRTKIQQTKLDSYYDVWMNDDLKKAYNVMVMDIQGYEYQALKGAIETIKKLDYILLEVWYKPLYANTVLKEEMDKFLEELGFYVKEHVPFDEYFGNCLYVRKDLL